MLKLTCCLKDGAVFPVCQMSLAHKVCRMLQRCWAISAAERQTTLCSN